MTDTPTAAELERAKKWASVQVPPVTVRCLGAPRNAEEPMYGFDNGPNWITTFVFHSEDDAFGHIAEVMRSVAPVLFEEAARVLENGDYDCGICDGCDCRIRGAIAAIRRLAAKEGM